jgi:hypothetical protein
MVDIHDCQPVLDHQASVQLRSLRTRPNKPSVRHHAGSNVLVNRLHYCRYLQRDQRLFQRSSGGR